MTRANYIRPAASYQPRRLRPKTVFFRLEWPFRVLFACVLVPEVRKKRARAVRFRRARALHAALLLACSLAAAACKDEDAPTGPTEPWRAGERPTSAGTSEERPISFFVVAEADLSFEGRGKKHAVRGTIPRVEGGLELDLEALEKIRGELTFDLARLVVHAHEEENEDGKADPSRSAEAKNWLSLGSQVDQDAKKKLSTASFQIQSAKLLTHRSAARGARQKPSELGLPEDQDWEVRRIRGTVQGELLLHGFAVSRALRADVSFAYRGSPSRKNPPERIVVQLLGAEKVPFAEHDILPRSESGHVDAKARELVGADFPASVEVRGKLTLVPRP